MPDNLDILSILWRAVDEGSTPVLVVMAWLLWKVERRLHEFITGTQAIQKVRDEKLDNIHDDVTAVIKKLAGIQT